MILKNDEILKKDVIIVSKDMLLEIPFNTIYSYANNLFDLKELVFADPSIQTQVDFFKKTKLSEIEYSNTDKNDFFTMTNYSTGESIQVSNRMSSRGELRGEKLRELLDQRKQENPDEVAYDTITRAIKTAECSDMVTMLRRAVSKGECAEKNYIHPMTEEHFELFTAMLLGKIQEKIQNKTLKNNLEPKDIRDSEVLQKIILKGIDIGAIYDVTQILTVNFQEIKEKGEELSNRGYLKAAKAALDLYSNLIVQKENLIQGKLSIQNFSENCNKLIEESQNSELKNHRGFFGSIWHGIKVALNAITFGAVAITPTKSIQKTIKLKDSLTNFVDSNASKVEDEGQPEENTDLRFKQ
ncbi:MAG: hypothetical protein A3E88_02540 [Legionellales bacterium RIFCSPHIGHO2_12_FULL_35_11]|nr:MAG: hypothetical protein A3E88_02540 [Legionellales bacterium RIFCSPHIGHO2_12_FULL_35_11]